MNPGNDRTLMTLSIAQLVLAVAFLSLAIYSFWNRSVFYPALILGVLWFASFFVIKARERKVGVTPFKERLEAERARRDEEKAAETDTEGR